MVQRQILLTLFLLSSLTHGQHGHPPPGGGRPPPGGHHPPPPPPGPPSDFYDQMDGRDDELCKGSVSFGSSAYMGIARCPRLSANVERMYFDVTGDLKPVADGYKTLLSSPLLISEKPSALHNGEKRLVTTRERYVQSVEDLEKLGPIKNWLWRFPLKYPKTIESEDCGFQIPDVDDVRVLTRNLPPHCEGGFLRDFCLPVRSSDGESEYVEIKYQITIHIPRRLFSFHNMPRVQVTFPNLAAKGVEYNNFVNIARKAILNRSTSLTLSSITRKPSKWTLLRLAKELHSGLHVRIKDFKLPEDVPIEQTNTIYVAAMVSCAQ